MRAVLQRVTSATVRVSGETVGQLKRPGLLVLLGVTSSDGEAEAQQLARKIARLRVLRNPDLPADEAETAPLVSASECEAPVLVVSQFTLYGSTRKGRTPSWSQAAPGPVAQPIYERLCELLRTEHGLEVQTGRFGAMMQVELVNDGPYTLLLES